MILQHFRTHRPATGVLIPFITIAIGFLSAPVRASAGESEPISWRTDYSGAFAEAKSHERLLWIQFTGPWCPNCTRMEQDSFPDPTIREHAGRSFIPVKLSAEFHEELALQFGLSGLPATVIVAPSREVIAVHQGYLNARDFDDFLRGALSQYEVKLAETRRLAASTRPSDPDKADPSPAEPKTRVKSGTKTETQVALSGYCPVSLISDKRLVPGQTEYTVTHEGRLYRFANRLTLNLFRRDPERYVPVNNGYCPVSQLDRGQQRPGDPRCGVLFQGRLFLCATKAERQQFLAEPARYAAVDVAEQGYCPHCLKSNGVLVRGDPRYMATKEGRKYWFPDSSHREAFLSASATAATRR